MKPSELKQKVSAIGSHYFDYSSMQFFGDTMANYGCRTAKHKDVECWELYRKTPVKCGLTNSSFFDKETFKNIS